MRNPIEYRKGMIRLGALCGVSMAALGAAPVMAQDSDEPAAASDDEIVVTGSRIPRAEFESLQPITTVGSELLNARAATNIADILNEQAVFATPDISPVGTQSGASVGQNFANVFGLGAQRTLTLVNGQRFPAGVSPSAGGGGLQVDLNAIPLGLVERIETIAVGGAPIYGADAIAGTVNIILKDDFEGVSYTGSFGINPEFGDAEEYRANIVAGKNFNDDNTNVVLSVDYSNVAGLLETDRPVTEEGLSFGTDRMGNDVIQVDPTVVVDGNAGGPLFFADAICFNTVCFNPFTPTVLGLPFGFGQPNGIPLDINDPNSPLTEFDSEGNLVPFIPGEGSGLIFRSGGSGLDLNELAALYTDLERINGNLIVNHRFSDRMKFRGEFWYARNDATELINQPLYNSPAFGDFPSSRLGAVGSGSIPILIDNPFLPDATRTTILNALNVVHDRNNDGIADPTIDTNGDGVPDAVGFARYGGLGVLVGPNPSRSKRDVFRAVAALEGDVEIAGSDYAWDISGSWGQTKSRDIGLGVNQERFERAVQVTADLAGNPVCLDPGPENDCVPLNLFGGPSQEAFDYVTAVTTDRTTIEQFVVSANIGGELFGWRAGTAGGAFGLSYRREDARFEPNEFDAQGLGRAGGVIDPIEGGFGSYEIYSEVRVPLMGEDFTLPLVRSLDFEGAARFVHNTVTGGDVTYTLGGRWGVFEGLEFRGNFTRSIRAPSITELFTPPSLTFLFADDPCDARFIADGNFPDRRASNCAAGGITQPFTSIVANASQRGFTSGNDQLNVETANSATFGLVFQPDFVPGLSVAVDWLDIKIADAISSLTLENVMEACYDSADFPNEPFCALFTRDPGSQQVIDFSVGFQNIDQTEFRGLQSVISYDVPMGDLPGELRLSANYLYTDEKISTRGEGNPVQDVGFVGTPRHVANVSATYGIGKFNWFNQGRYISGTEFRDLPFSIGGWGVYDTSLSYDVRDELTVQVAVDNVFNRKAPFLTPASGSAITTYFSGIQGRYVTFSVRGSF